MYLSRVIIASITAGFFLGSLSYAGDRKFERSFKVTPGQTLRLKTDVGSATIIGYDRDEVVVEVTIRGRERDRERFEVAAEQVSDGIEIRGEGGRTGWMFWKSWDLDVHYSVRVPMEFNAKIKTAGGDITISRLRGNVETRTSGGDIVAGEIDGSVLLETSGGDIRIEHIVGRVTLETSGGDIHAESLKGEVKATTSGGDIHLLMVEGEVRGQTSGGDIVVKMKQENRGVDVSTSGGDVDIWLSRTFSATVDASTTGGEVRCDLPVTISGKVSEHSMKGTINGGGSRLRARTSGGDIRFRAMD